MFTGPLGAVGAALFALIGAALWIGVRRPIAQRLDESLQRSDEPTLADSVKPSPADVTTDRKCPRLDSASRGVLPSGN
jgi:hypothetical protein